MDALVAYRWPGNVRELINVTEFVSVTRSGQEVRPEHLPPEFLEEDESEDEAPMREAGVATVVAPQAETQLLPIYGKRRLTEALIREALDLSGGNTTEAAQRLGVSRPTLWRWRKKLGLE
jgi:transcriptional regulator of acetoin/glycerol metabolism